jgi:hypothetical protein
MDVTVLEKDDHKIIGAKGKRHLRDNEEMTVRLEGIYTGKRTPPGGTPPSKVFCVVVPFQFLEECRDVPTHCFPSLHRFFASRIHSKSLGEKVVAGWQAESQGNLTARTLPHWSLAADRYGFKHQRHQGQVYEVTPHFPRSHSIITDELVEKKLMLDTCLNIQEAELGGKKKERAFTAPCFFLPSLLC